MGNIQSSNKYFCLRCKDKNFLIQCECGTCEEVIPRYHINGTYRKYAFNHHFRLAKNKRDQRGEKNCNYKGGIYFDDGYWMLTNKWDHPNCQKSDGAISRHVYNFTVRNGKLFCCMLPWGIVHHIIPVDKDGTDDLSNLQGMMRTKHIGYHHEKDMSDRKCNLCNGKTYTKPNGYEDWRTDINGFLCVYCYLMIDYFKKKFSIS
jgi:hypothetical protein